MFPARTNLKKTTNFTPPPHPHLITYYQNPTKLNYIHPSSFHILLEKKRNGERKMFPGLTNFKKTRNFTPPPPPLPHPLPPQELTFRANWGQVRSGRLWIFCRFCFLARPDSRRRRSGVRWARRRRVKSGFFHHQSNNLSHHHHRRSSQLHCFFKLPALPGGQGNERKNMKSRFFEVFEEFHEFHEFCEFCKKIKYLKRE